MSKIEAPKKYFEDFAEGDVFEYRVAGVTPQEIKDFAKLYDPQAFHLDEAEAAKTHFGDLVASGFQTQLLCFGPFCRQVLLNSGSVGAPGVNIKWLRPWYPDIPLDVAVTLVSKRLSSKSNDRGYMSMVLEAKADDVAILAMDWTVIMLTQHAKYNE